ncbi:MAG: hypothetical protein Q9217_002031 [Psora testacea]
MTTRSRHPGPSTREEGINGARRIRREEAPFAGDDPAAHAHPDFGNMHHNQHNHNERGSNHLHPLEGGRYQGGGFVHGSPAGGFGRRPSGFPNGNFQDGDGSALGGFGTGPNGFPDGVFEGGHNRPAGGQGHGPNGFPNGMFPGGFRDGPGNCGQEPNDGPDGMFPGGLGSDRRGWHNPFDGSPLDTAEMDSTVGTIIGGEGPLAPACQAHPILMRAPLVDVGTIDAIVTR